MGNNIPVVDRFLAKVSRCDGGCWLWGGAASNNGYGHFQIPGAGVRGAHRAAWLLFRGAIPDGLYVCHRCDVRACVNPDHLFLGTATDNMRDASAKHRLSTTHGKRGSLHYAARFSEKDVADIRTARANGEPSRTIARRLGCSPSAIQHIVKGRSWSHLSVALEADGG